MVRAGEHRRGRVEDLLAIPEGERFHEIIDGEILEKAAPSGEHGDAQSWLVAILKPEFARRQGGPRAGGWWIQSEVEVELAADQVYRPDVVGWRRERCPDRPVGNPIRSRPDWVCEVLSPSNASTDTVTKLRRYHAFGVPHYWIVDPRQETLTVYRYTRDGYLVVLAARTGDRIRPEPFEAIELEVGILFGREEE